MRYSITSNSRISQRIWKNMFSPGKNSKHIGNSMHTTEFWELGKSMNIYINYLIFYQSRQHLK